MRFLNFVGRQFNKAFLTPARAMKRRYLPLLLIYFSYGLAGFSAIALSFWEKESLSLSAEQLISISVWVMVPWTLKMVFGQMVDAVNLFGNRRKSYIFLGAFLMIIGSVLLAGLAGRYEWVMWIGNEYVLYLLSAIFMTFGFVIQDVTADTMTTEVVDRMEIKNGKQVLRSDSAVQSELSMVQLLGRLALSLAAFSVAGLGGWLAQNLQYETIFWMTLAIPFISCVGVLFVRLEKVENHERKPLNKQILFWGLVFAVFSVAMAVSDLPFSQEIVFGVSLVLLSAMMCLITKDLPRSKFRILALTLLVLFLYRITPYTGPGLQWWMIDQLGFDQMFFGVLAQLGALVALLVLWFFSDFIANKPIRSVLIFLVFMDAIMSLPELGLYFGLHDALGMSAQSVALFDTALGSPLVNISMVPLLALLAFYAPAGYRGTWFAIGASLMNLALSGGRILTKYLNEIFVVTREVIDEQGAVLVSADYSDLGILMIVRTVFAFIIPLLAILLFLRKTPRISPEFVQEDISEQAPIPPQKRVEE
jgi:MFS family permease